MPSKVTYFLLALLLLGGMALFAWTNPSYQKAFEAKWYYFTGDYDTAYTLAKEAYRLDPYNRMALTVMTRTEIAQRYLVYIREGNSYLERIEKIADKGVVPEADRVRVKLMCEVMLGEYETLPRGPMVDSELAKEAQEIYDKFRTLYDSLFRRGSKSRPVS